MRLRFWFLAPLILSVLAGLAGCAVVNRLESTGPTIDYPVWLPDGWIYYRYQAGLDAPFEVWRSRPDGSHAARFVAPASSGCPGNVVWYLFPGPGGNLGATEQCAGATLFELIEYPTAGGAPVKLGEIPGLFSSWTRDRHTGYIAQSTYLAQSTSGCLGIAEIRDGVIVPSPVMITLNGVTSPLSPSAKGCPSNSVATRNPAISPDGGRLFVLATMNQPSLRDPDMYLDSVPWQLVRIDDNGRSTPIGPPLTGLTTTAVSPDGRTVAMTDQTTDHERIILVPADGGPTRDVAVRTIAFGFSFSPDSRSLVTTDDRALRIIRV